MLNSELFRSSYEDFDQEIINEIIQMFFDDYQQAIRHIQDAINQKDAQKLAQSAHKYKGTVGSMYDFELKDDVQKLEHIGKNDQIESSDTETLMAKVVEKSDLLVQQLKTMIK